MNLQLIGYQVNDLSLQKVETASEEKEKSFDMNYSINYNTQNEATFAIVFDIKIYHEGEFELDMKYVAWFQASEKINDEFRNSHFPSINAPAIAFPFLRSCIATLTLNSGFPPAILPSVNFVEVSKNRPPEVEG